MSNFRRVKIQQKFFQKIRTLTKVRKTFKVKAFSFIKAFQPVAILHCHMSDELWKSERFQKRSESIVTVSSSLKILSAF